MSFLPTEFLLTLQSFRPGFPAERQRYINLLLEIFSFYGGRIRKSFTSGPDHRLSPVYDPLRNGRTISSQICPHQNV